MTGHIALEPGPPNALWNSDGIRLRSQQETDLQNIGPHIDPTSGSSYFAYVKVTNTDPIGTVYPPQPVPDPAWTVYLRRFRVTTMPDPSDYTDLGQSSVWPNAGQSLWTEFPSQPIIPAGSTPGQVHYCLQAMGDASPSDLPAPTWAGLILTDRHFAQRNLVFA